MNEAGDQTDVVASASQRTRKVATSSQVTVDNVDLVPLAGTAGDELDARQAAAIKEILLWLSRRQDQTRPG